MREPLFYSYDIFDTCLIRSCGKPSSVFTLLAERILGTNALNESLRNDFVLERLQGEQIARNVLIKGECEDVTLDEIYQFCDFSFATQRTKEEILDTELKIELEVLVPVYSIKEEISILHSSGKNVMFISDMYLSKGFLEKILRNNDLMKDGDSLYVSCEERKTKSTGHLFEHIKQIKGILYKKWIHKGDNKISDVKVPSKLGIKAELVVHNMTHYERQLYKKDFSCSRMDVQLLASICKAVRVQNSNDTKVLFAADFIAPMYVPFVWHILQEARQRDIRKLYFLARDGYIFYIIAQQFRKEFQDIELHYLYVSRNSLYLPGLKDISIESIEDMFFSLSGIGIKEILDRLQMDNYDYSHLQLSEKSGHEIIEILINDNHFIDLLSQKKKEQYDLTLRYFEQEGLNTGNCAIVDLTGTRKCQLAINRILDGKGYKPVFGFYYKILSARIKGEDYYSPTYEERMECNSLNFSLLPHDLLEQYFSITNHLRTCSYKQEHNVIVPVFEKENIDETYKKKAFEVNKSICTSFANIYKQILSDAAYSTLNGAISSVYSEFYHIPEISYLKAFEGLKLSDSKLKSLPLLIKGKSRFSNNVRQSPWYYGNLVYNSYFPNILVKVMRIQYADGNNPYYPRFLIEVCIDAVRFRFWTLKHMARKLFTKYRILN